MIKPIEINGTMYKVYCCYVCGSRPEYTEIMVTSQHVMQCEDEKCTHTPRVQCGSVAEAVDHWNEMISAECRGGTEGPVEAGISYVQEKAFKMLPSQPKPTYTIVINKHLFVLDYCAGCGAHPMYQKLFASHTFTCSNASCGKKFSVEAKSNITAAKDAWNNLMQRSNKKGNAKQYKFIGGPQDGYVQVWLEDEDPFNYTMFTRNKDAVHYTWNILDMEECDAVTDPEVIYAVYRLHPSIHLSGFMYKFWKYLIGTDETVLPTP